MEKGYTSRMNLTATQLGLKTDFVGYLEEEFRSIRSVRRLFDNVSKYAKHAKTAIGIFSSAQLLPMKKFAR